MHAGKQAGMLELSPTDPVICRSWPSQARTPRCPRPHGGRSKTQPQRGQGHAKDGEGQEEALGPHGG